MKKIIKAAALALTAALAVSTLSVLNCSAYSDYSMYDEYIFVQKEPETDFVILAYKNNDGELTVTGCYDYDPEFTVNPFTNGRNYGFIAVFVCDGVLQIPSHIDDNLVTEIKNLSGNKSFDTIVVPDAITKIKRTAFCGIDYTVETAVNEYRVKTLYC